MRKKSGTRDLQGCLVILLAALGVGFILLRNPAPPVQYTPPITPSPLVVTLVNGQGNPSIGQVLTGDLLQGLTLVPTPFVPTAYIVPTHPPQPTAALIDPGNVVLNPPTLIPTRVARRTATLPGATSVPSPTPLSVVGRNDRLQPGEWTLPPEIVPMSRDLRDHFYFRRPVDSNANSSSLSYYPYGSAGPRGEWRVHHGLDMPNPDGQPVRAAADGVVVWADNNYRWAEDGYTDAAESYGNVVIIEHRFGYRGQRLYTLYAHLSRILVLVNDQVKVDDVIGLSGHSGNVTGPHVHFEVRQGQNFYWTTRNPLLWMAPLIDHGVVAGRVLAPNGRMVEQAVVTLIQGGRVFETTMTYVNPKRVEGRGHNVVPDDEWRENFVFGDVPVGRYEVSVNLNGTRFTRTLDVQAGTTSFVDFGALLPANAAGVPTVKP